MSKDQGLGFVESAAQASFVPSAPPSYDEAMQQSGATYSPMPVQPVPMHLPLAQVPAAQTMPLTMYTPAIPAPETYPSVQPPAQPATTIVFTSLGPDRSLTVCPHCNSQVMTETQEKYKCLAHFFCCCLMFSCPCFSCVPYCLDSCKIVKHKCPNCNAKLGTYRP